MSTSLFRRTLSSPLGDLLIECTSDAVTRVQFGISEVESTETCVLLESCAQQLAEYFRGDRTMFTLPVQPTGTAFEQQVWSELQTVSYGSTQTYGYLAHRLNNPKSIRAVGRANGKNPIGIIIPCHRIIGADGSLTGYAGELWRKRWLLDHEAKNSGQLLF